MKAIMRPLTIRYNMRSWSQGGSQSLKYNHDHRFDSRSWCKETMSSSGSDLDFSWCVSWNYWADFSSLGVLP